MNKIPRIVYGVAGTIAGLLLSKWTDKFIPPHVSNLATSLFMGLGPPVLLIWIGVRAHRFSTAIDAEKRVPPVGWEEQYGKPTTDEAIVRRSAWEARFSSRILLLIAVVWLLGAGYIAYVA